MLSGLSRVNGSIHELLYGYFYLQSQIILFNPQAPVAKKNADEVVFRHLQGEGVDFFYIGPQ